MHHYILGFYGGAIKEQSLSHERFWEIFGLFVFEDILPKLLGASSIKHQSEFFYFRDVRKSHSYPIFR